MQDTKQVTSKMQQSGDGESGANKLPKISRFIIAWEFIALGLAGLVIATLVTILGDNDKLIEITQTVFLVGVLVLVLAFFLIRFNEQSDTSKQLKLAQEELELKKQEYIDRTFTEATEQLGHESAEIRTSAAYKLVELADAHGDSRKQQVVDTFCGYLRTPRPELEVWDFLGQKHFKDTSVEATIVGLITTRLHRNTPLDKSWRDCNFELSGARFQTPTDWNNCVFHGNADFSAVEFEHPVSFSGTKFANSVSFAGAKFSESAEFLGVNFLQQAGFSDTEFNGTTNFAQTKFNDQAEFDRAVFWGAVTFKDAAFSSKASFNATEFHGVVDFVQANFDGSATATAAQFFDGTWFGGAFNPPARPKAAPESDA